MPLILLIGKRVWQNPDQMEPSFSPASHGRNECLGIVLLLSGFVQSGERLIYHEKKLIYYQFLLPVRTYVLSMILAYNAQEQSPCHQITMDWIQLNVSVDGKTSAHRE